MALLSTNMGRVGPLGTNVGPVGINIGDVDDHNGASHQYWPGR